MTNTNMSSPAGSLAGLVNRKEEVSSEVIHEQMES